MENVAAVWPRRRAMTVGGCQIALEARAPCRNYGVAVQHRLLRRQIEVVCLETDTIWFGQQDQPRGLRGGPRARPICSRPLTRLRRTRRAVVARSSGIMTRQGWRMGRKMPGFRPRPGLRAAHWRTAAFGRRSRRNGWRGRRSEGHSALSAPTATACVASHPPGWPGVLRITSATVNTPANLGWLVATSAPGTSSTAPGVSANRGP